METLHYHNSTNQKAEIVLEETRNCKSQEEIIFDIFKLHGKLTASEVLNKFPKDIPLTSIRRAMSNLKFDKKLIKLDETKIGIYAKPERYYSLVKNQLELFI